jgi:hypothetical protein
MGTPSKVDNQFSEKEAAERRDATIKRMIAMPPKPHSEMKVGKKKKSIRKKTTKARTPHVIKKDNSV